MIEFRCPTCGKFLKLPHSHAGTTTTCPGCMKPVSVPGAPAGSGATPQAPKPVARGMQLCVDCGGAFPSGEMMQHNGQAVCTNCFNQRKPVKLKPIKKRRRREPGKGRKRVVVLVVLAALLAGGVIVYLLMR